MRITSEKAKKINNYIGKKEEIESIENQEIHKVFSRYLFKTARGAFKSRYIKLKTLSSGFLAMGIIGSSITGLSLGTIVILGIACLLFDVLIGGIDGAEPLITPIFQSWIFWSIIGGVCLFIALPLFIVGLALYGYFYKKAGKKAKRIKLYTNINTDAQKIDLAFSFKIMKIRAIL